jgi:hypothetical protein
LFWRTSPLLEDACVANTATVILPRHLDRRRLALAPWHPLPRRFDQRVLVVHHARSLRSTLTLDRHWELTAKLLVLVQLLAVLACRFEGID